MATIWVRADGSGDDGNNGSSYILAKATYSSALTAASAGDTINLVNDGQHVMRTLVSQTRITNKVGTSWAAPGLVIRGCDSSGNAALVDLIAHSDAGGNYGFEVYDNTDYIHIKGIRFLAHTGTATPYQPINILSPATGNIKITDCQFWGTEDVAAGTSKSNVCISASAAGGDPGSVPVVEICGCMFVNIRGPLLGYHYRDWNIHNNIFITRADTVTSGSQLALTWTNTGADTSVRRFYNNTCIFIHDAEIDGQLTTSGSDDTNVLAHYNNLYYIATSHANGFTGVVQQGFATATAGTPVRLGYDVFVINTPNWSSATTDGYGSYQFNQDFCDGEAWDSQDLHPNSTEANGTEFADVFFDVTVEYEWTPYEYTHTLPYDLRPVIGRTSGYDGAVVGAIDDTINPIIDPGEGDDPLPRQYVDTAPFFRPTLDVSTEIRIRTKRNRREHHDLANYTRRETWNESTHRVINLATNTTTQLTLGGVETAQYLFVESDYPIDVSINDTTRYWEDTDAVAVALTEVSTVYLRNNSTTNTAQVFVAVVD